MNSDEISEILEKQFAKFAGQLTRHIDERIDAHIADLRTTTDKRFDRLETMMDAVAKRITDDEAERTAITIQQDRHNGWIGQLASATGTNLTPPLQ